MKLLLALNNDLWGYLFYKKVAPLFTDHSVLLSQSYAVFDEGLYWVENFLGETIIPDWQPLDIVQKINTLEYKKLAQDYDLILSVRFLKIFDDEFCKIPKNGIINLHSGLLPSYRGMLTSFWSMLNQETDHGFCVHYVDDKTIDTGRIIQNVMLDTKNINSISMANILFHKYMRMTEVMPDILNKVSIGSNIKTYPSEGISHYYSKPSFEDISKFKDMGCVFYTPEDIKLIQQALL